ncbi:hypothetical protein C0Q70_00009 [Pomacea canaliculata]|uniref:Cadherin domain-containing protein n=1 Tax=Pomacea canaliculata TaxID=400727 RepID=A0A2T7PVH4_POMCA|nr:hypothetical protein C0Q70_00009 [Pomacea canaliculata]
MESCCYYVQLILQVKDEGRSSKTGTAAVSVIVVRNLYSPVCSTANPDIVINFDTSPGKDIGFFNATDQDPNQTVHYVLTGTSQAMEYCSVDSAGVIRLKKAIAPKSGLTFQDNVAFTLTGQPSDQDWFSINSSSGQIYVAKDVRQDPLKRTQYLLVVQAVRQMEVTRQSASATVTVNVNRNLNAPVFMGNYERTLDENSLLGTSVVQLMANDSDVNDKITYRYVSPDNFTDYFYLGPSSGLISLRKALTSIGVDRTTFVVAADDNAAVNPKSASATVIINITRDKQPPNFVADPYVTTVTYDIPVGTSIYQATATDPDLIGPLVFETGCGYQAAPFYFNIHSNGTVFLQNPLISDSAISYVLCLSVYDRARPNSRDFTNITISVDRNPNACKFTTLNYNATFLETELSGASVFTAQAADADLRQTLRYSIVSANPPGCDVYFYLNEYTGSVMPARSLLNSGFDICRLTFSAMDSGTPPKSCTNQAIGTINIVRNKFPPVIQPSQYATYINEALADGSLVFDLNATDQDSTDPSSPFASITYSLIGDDNIGSYFQVESSTGIIRKTQSLTGPDSKDVYISIERTVYEDDPVSTIIATVTATDADRAGPQSTLSFLLSGQSSYFRLQPAVYIQQGVYSVALTYNQPLYVDPNRTSPYRFNLTVQDAGSSQLSSSIPVTIYVIRNLQDPVFSQTLYTASLSYLAKVGDILTTVTATDADTDRKYNTSSLRYSIIQRSATPYFTINEITGQITLAQQVTNDTATSYTITVQAKDGGTPSREAFALVYFGVERNLNTPRILIVNSTVTVLETDPAQVLYQFTAVDDDLQSPYKSVVFSMVNTDNVTRQYFDVYSNGAVFTRQQLSSLPSPNTFGIEVLSCDLGPKPLCSNQHGLLTVNVIRNHPPFFVDLPYDRDLNTGFSPGQTVMDVNAQDPDSSTIVYGQLIYSIIGDDGNEKAFTINPSTGVVTVNNSASAVTGESFQLRIQVCDRGQLCATTVAKITVRTNQQAPVISPNSYSREILETFPLGDTIFDVNATDGDLTPPNNQFSFSLQPSVSSSYLGCFSINSDSGVIYAIRPLYRPPCNESQYRFQVVATDKGRTPLLSLPASVSIDVIKNQNPPVFVNKPYNRTVNENTPVGNTIIRISAVDVDTRAPYNTLSFAKLGDAAASSYFNIIQADNNNIDIVLAQSLINSGRDVYTLELYVADGGLPPLFDTCIVTFTAVRNLSPPSFSPLQYNFEVDEDQVLGISVGRLTASDPDAPKPGSGDIVYSLQGGLTQDSYFDVLSNGNVVVVRDLTQDPVKRNSYTFLATVRDLGSPSLAGTNTATVTVTTNRNNNCPTFTNLPAEVTTNATDTGVIFTAQSRDADVWPKFNRTYYSLYGDGAFQTFFIDRDTGAITVNNGIRQQTDLVYKLQVQVNDGFCISPSQGTLTIKVRRNMYVPRWPASGPNITVTVLETWDIQQSIVTLTATDDDTGVGSQLTYHLDNSTDQKISTLFFIMPSGPVFLRRSLVGVPGDIFQMTVRAVDDGGLQSQPGTLTVIVQRNNFTPEILNLPNNITIHQNLSNTQEITRCTARDNDTVVNFKTVNFGIVGEGLATAALKIETSTCSLTLRNTLGADTPAFFIVKILAYDLAGDATRSSTGTLTIFVNSNLNRPEFDLMNYDKVILETQPVGVPFDTVKAHDADTVAPFGDISYTAVGDNDTLTYFGITSNGGLVALRSQWEYPDRQKTIFSYRIIMRDGGGLQSTSTASVSVTVIRNTGPIFTNTATYATTVQETTPNGTTVFRPSVRETDTVAPFNTLQCQLIGDGATSAFFSVVSSSSSPCDIVLHSSLALAQDTGTRYIARVFVRDGGTPPLSDTATVVITVPRNNFDPDFISRDQTVRIPYNQVAGTVVANVTATDNDGTGPEATLTYAMISGNTNNNREYFKVYPDNGQVILVDNTNLASIDRFVMYIRVSDDGQPQRSSTGTVTVIVDKDPDQLRCNQEPFSFSVPETSSVNFNLGTVIAGPGTNVVYMMIPSPPGSNYFNVSSTGGVYISSSLTREPASLTSYTILVRATRSAVAVTSVTCTLNIQVYRNANSPVFQLPPNLNDYRYTIPDSTSIGSVVGTISASDADGDTVSYSINSSNPVTSAFYLHPILGSITLTHSLIGVNISSYSLIVRASDQRRPDERTAQATVYITILHDLYDPQFSQDMYTFTNIREDAGSNAVIGTVTASDSDLKGQLVFEIVGRSTGPAFFQLANPVANGNSATLGVLVKDASYLRRDQSGNYTLDLTVYDSAYPDRKDTCTVVISMLRNLNAPSFNSTNYNVQISELTAAGSVIFTGIAATDADGDSLLFSILPSIRSDYYYINPFSGHVSLIHSLLGTNYTSDLLNIEVRDQRLVGEKRSSATLTVQIIRVFPPVFTNLPAAQTVTRSAPAGSLIYTVSTTSQNPQGVINYQLVGIYPSLLYFTINRSTGEVRLNSSLLPDPLCLQSYELEIIAFNTNNPDLQATSTLTVRVDRNPSPPICNPNSIDKVLALDANVGDIVGTVSATDPEGNQPRYRFLTADQEDLRHFLVTPDTGNIILLQPLSTLGQSTVFTFTVEASDQACISPKNCTTTVRFTLGTDQPPVFSQTSYYWSINESAFQQASVYNLVTARDPDLQGKRKVGRPKQTWRRSVESEAKAAGTTWAQLRGLPKAGFAGEVLLRPYAPRGVTRNDDDDDDDKANV